MAIESDEIDETFGLGFVYALGFPFGLITGRRPGSYYRYYFC